MLVSSAHHYSSSHHIFVSHAGMKICYFCLMESIYVTWLFWQITGWSVTIVASATMAQFYGWDNTGVWTLVYPITWSLYQPYYFGGTYNCLLGINGSYVPPKHLYPPTRLHHVTVPKTTTWILWAMNISNLKACIYAVRTKVTKHNVHNNNILDKDASILGMTSCRTVHSSTETSIWAPPWTRKMPQ